jgi:hypothetical protein
VTVPTTYEIGPAGIGVASDGLNVGGDGLNVGGDGLVACTPGRAVATTATTATTATADRAAAHCHQGFLRDRFTLLSE